MTRCLLIVLGLFVSAVPALSQCYAPRATYSSASYSSYYQPSYAPTYYPQVVEKVVYRDVVIPVTKYVAYPVAFHVVSPYEVPVPVPAAAPARAAPAAAPAKAPCDDLAKQVMAGMDKVLTRMDSFDRRLALLEGRGGAAPAPPAYAPAPAAEPAPPVMPKANGEALAAPKGAGMPASFATACAVCHQKGNEGHGGDVVLADERGNPVRLGDRMLQRVDSSIYKGTMPKLNARAKAHGITGKLDDRAYAEWKEWVEQQLEANRKSPVK